MRKLLILLLFLITNFNSYSQVNIELTEIDSNRIEINLIPTRETSAIVSNLVFTIKSKNIEFTEIYSNLSIQRLTSEYYGEYKYTTFNSINFDNISLNQKIIINYIGKYAQIEIINDDITESKNSDYYISLNGKDSTGRIINKKVRFLNFITVPISFNFLGQIIETPNGIRIVGEE